MLIRSTLIISLYKKGLRLSGSARQAHGVGQIVNYMAVDAQQLSDMMLQLHFLCLCVADYCGLVILYQYLGTSTLAAFAGLALVIAFVAFRTKKNNRYQFNIKERDSRMKATNEMLSYMRCYGAPLIATITFGSAVLFRFPLSVASVFTTTSLLKMLQEPIRTFPQSMISLSQAIISLERLDRFMTSKELVDNSVERVVGCDGDTAVEVKDGSFSWDDENGEEVEKI
ncbi:UNVERIFIED_CONTAM: ABC transporter C family member 4 [Sesamum latifolium]|uniref:ABC transporter C family member 4 n=1 Tax=Sesamum latifolium TaxID=2727402 RepID=A0AAW2Y1M8_9LAMI